MNRAEKFAEAVNKALQSGQKEHKLDQLAYPQEDEEMMDTLAQICVQMAMYMAQQNSHVKIDIRKLANIIFQKITSEYSREELHSLVSTGANMDVEITSEDVNECILEE